MSTEYVFYFGRQGKDKKISLIGPYFKNEEGELKATPFYWVSNSWAYDIKDEFWDLGSNYIADDSKATLTYENSWDEDNKICTNAKYLKWNEMPITKMFKEVYIPRNMYKTIKSNPETIDDVYWCDDDFVTVEEVGRMTSQERERLLKDKVLTNLECTYSKDWFFAYVRMMASQMELNTKDLVIIMDF